MKTITPIILLAVAALALPAPAQPDLATLWPNADGQRWTYTQNDVEVVCMASNNRRGKLRSFLE